MTVTLVVGTDQLEGGEIRLEGDRYRHLFRARRLAVRDRIRLTDGAGRVAAAVIASVDPETARLEIESRTRPLVRPPGRELIAPLLKQQRTAWLVEKATELEVGAIRFYSGPRAPRTLTEAARQRLLRIAIAAIEQSQGAWLPQIFAAQPLDRVIAAAADIPRLQCVQGGPEAPASCCSAVWAIGAEGGWTDDETDALQQAGFVPVGLGRTVLRVETAAVAALSLSAASAAGD